MWKINITGKGAEGDRVRTFAIYALCVILFFVFSNIMIQITLKTMYDPIDTYKTEPAGIELDINEAKATYVNGYVGGTIKNNNSEITKTYIKIDLYTKRNVCMGSKYIELNNLKQSETRDFRIGFQYTDIDYARITLVNEVPEQVPAEFFVSNELKGIFLLKTVLFLCIFG